jgi:hypothetical protein
LGGLQGSVGSAYQGQESVSGPRLLDKAIYAYLRGFETDWRDAYLGINAVTLMVIFASS